ncbi:hypothetical protein [Auritidibacter ignavus]|uniref:hypothetical protein n=1 Tax=Auritidibacter ignavus TaxID=678932 RepID=UPI002FE561C5
MTLIETATGAYCTHVAPHIQQWSEGPGVGDLGVAAIEKATLALETVVDEVQGVQAEIEQLASRLRDIGGLDWHSMAGEAFKDKTRRTEAKTRDISDSALAMKQAGRKGIDELRVQAAQARDALNAARSTVADIATGVC